MIGSAGPLAEISNMVGRICTYFVDRMIGVMFSEIVGCMVDRMIGAMFIEIVGCTVWLTE
jgi:uncharacterized membrane protein required for colicin V production